MHATHFLIFWKTLETLCNFIKQECIPTLGCVPPAAVAVHGGVCLSACWDTPPPSPRCGPGTPLVWAWIKPFTWVWAWSPPHGVGLETPLARPLNVAAPWSLGLDYPPCDGNAGIAAPVLETVGKTVDTTPPAARHAGIPPVIHAGIPPPLLQGMLGYHPPPLWTDRHL